MDTNRGPSCNTHNEILTYTDGIERRPEFTNRSPDSCLFVSIRGFLLLTSIGLLTALGAQAGEIKDAGQKIYVAKCAKCHELPSPSKYSKEEWERWLVKMSKKSRLDAQQSETVAQYTEQLRKAKK